MNRILFTNVSIFDGSGGPTFRGDVLVQENSIAAVTRAPGKIDATDALLINAANATLMPGFCDAHAHLGFGSSVEGINPPRERTTEEAALLMAHCGRVYLDHGYTNAYSAGSHSVEAEIATARAFEAGWIPGPRLRTSSFERTPGGSAGPRTQYAGLGSRSPDPQEIADFVKAMAAKGVDSVKFVLNGVSAFVSGSNLVDQFYPEEIAAAGRAARESHVRLSAHAYTPDMIKNAIESGFSVVYHCTWADERTLDLMEAHRDDIFVGPAPGITEADWLRGPAFGVMVSEADREEQAEAIERMKWLGKELHKRGIRTVPGGDYGLPWNPVGLNARDIQLFVEWFGYTPAQALSAATQLGGCLMQMGDRLGLVTENYLADLVLMDGDPTVDIGLVTDRSKFLAVMKDGKFYRTPPERCMRSAEARLAS